MGFPFVTLGYLMARHEAALRLSRATLSRALLAGLVLLVAEALLNHVHAPRARSFDLLVMLPFVCPLLVLWARGIPVAADTRSLAQVSTGIYLVHPLILDRIRVLTDLPATPQVALTIAISALVALAGLHLMRALPAMRGPRASRPPAPRAAQDASR